MGSMSMYDKHYTFNIKIQFNIFDTLPFLYRWNHTKKCSMWVSKKVCQIKFKVILL